MTQESFGTQLFTIPLAFAFTIHMIASRYYTHETRFHVLIDKDIEQVNAHMLKGTNFENFLPDFVDGVNKPKDGIYKLESFNLPMFEATGTVKNTKESLIFLNMGKSYMVSCSEVF